MLERWSASAFRRPWSSMAWEIAGAAAGGGQRERGGTTAEVHDNGTRGYPKALDEGQLGLEIRALLGIMGGDLVDAVEVHPDLTELIVVPARKLHRLLRVPLGFRVLLEERFHEAHD